MPLTRRHVLLGGSALCISGLSHAAAGFNWTATQIAGLYRQANASEAPLPKAVLDEILERGGWSMTADDDTKGETLAAGFVRERVLNYRDHPQDPDAQTGLALIALTLGVAQWGIEDPDGLPDDPAQDGWKAQSGANTGKHLMSYGVGGIGIFHADDQDLLAFIHYVLEAGLIPPEHQPAFRRLADPALYSRIGAGVYDQLRAAGVCTPASIDVDLEGAAFKHFAVAHNEKYCEKYKNPSLTLLDWQVFRTWTRVGLRTRAGQEWLLRLWLTKYWDKTLAQVPPGDGAAEEALVNVRIRNSLPISADRALKIPATDVEGRIQRELDAYQKYIPSAYKRRCALMLRSVVLYRHFSGAPPLRTIKCGV